jgi:hypothetical protein
MIRRSLLSLAFTALAVSQAAAQPSASTEVTPPRALVRQLFADLEPDHLLRREGLAEIPRAITAERRDLNGDGRPEWFVVGIRVCGNANCPRWIYRELPDGRFQQVYDGAGVRIDVQPLRSVGWPELVSVGHMSSRETVLHTSRFDGRRYVWRDTKYLDYTNASAPKTVYQVSLSDADARDRRVLVLSPMDAGGGLWISAHHDVCPRGREAECGAPQLVLQSAGLPAGRACVRFRSEEGEGTPYASTPGERWCGVTTAAPLPGGRAGRRLVVRPTRRDWAQMAAVYDVILSGPGLPGKLETDAVGALMAFGWALRDVYTLPCVRGTECRSRAR